MSNVLPHAKQQQIIALGQLGWSVRRIREATGVHRDTIRQYLATAGVAVRLPGSGALPSNQATLSTGPEGQSSSLSSGQGAASNQARVSTPDLASTGRCPVLGEVGVSPTASACEPFRSFVEDSLAKGRNAIAIYQDLVDDHGFKARYASVKRFVRKIRGATRPLGHPVIQTEPGLEGQVDYGEGPMVLHPKTGKYRRTRLFVLVLGYSRKAVRLLRFESSSQIWAELHEEAFRRLGAAPKTIVLDNLAEGVLLPEVYDPTLNPLFRDVLRHYGVTGLPCRVGHSDRKGKVESGVGHAQATPLQGLRFESLAKAQAYLDRWEANWADTREHGTTKRRPIDMFEEERPHLLPLPVTPFRYYEFGDRYVNLNSCVEVEAGFYAAPEEFVTQYIPVQWDGNVVRILHPRTGQLIAEHLRTFRGGFRVPPDLRPRRTPPALEELVARAHRAGTAIGAVCDAILLFDPLRGPARIQGVLALGRKHGGERLESACAAVNDRGIPHYQAVKKWLLANPAAEPQFRQDGPLVRGLTEYRDLIDRMTKEVS